MKLNKELKRLDKAKYQQGDEIARFITLMVVRWGLYRGFQKTFTSNEAREIALEIVTSSQR